MLAVLVICLPGEEELTAILEKMVLYNCPVIITSDLNLHLDVAADRDAR